MNNGQWYYLGRLTGLRSSAQTGVALLTVMFMLVLLTTLVVYMVEDEHLAIRRIQNQRDMEQSYQMVTGAEQWALKILERDMKENKTDHFNESWSSLLAEVGVEEGKLSANAIDLQGRFNLNNLTTKDELWYPMFQRLLRVLEVDESLVDAVLDWVDSDIDVNGSQGAEDAEYLLKSPSYRAANRSFSDIGELVWVDGFNNEIISKLSPYVTALPTTDARININTASLIVMRALGPELLSDSVAQALIDGRGDDGYEDLQSFLVSSELAGLGDRIAPLISIKSDYFEVKSKAEFGRLSTVLYSLIMRRPQTLQAFIIQRKRGLT